MRGWVICPKCLDAMEGEIGAPCFVCGTLLVDTPLSAAITAKVLGDSPVGKLSDRDLMIEMGLS